MSVSSVYFRSRLAALLLTAALPLGFAVFAQEPANDPLPLTRVLIAPDQLAAQLERVKQGVLIHMPRAEFEKRLSEATKKAADGKNAPRLIEAHYRATLQTEPALVGTGQWKTINPARGPALLPLQPLNLALRQARFENAGDARPDALIADFDGRNPALLLEKPGEYSIALDWSARADVRPEGWYFALEFPPAPVAILELNLPADQIVNVGAGVALSGPHPAEMDNRRLWKISCSGQPGLNFWIRRSADAANAPPLIFVRQQTTQKLTPEGQEAWFQFDLEAPRPGVRLLEFEADPELRPCEATATNGEPLPLSALPGPPGRWLIRLPEPLAPGTETITIRCLAPFGTPVKGVKPGLVTWTSPAMRLVRVASRENAPEQTGWAVLRGEALEVRAHPDVRLDTWQSGAFHLLSTTTKPDGERQTPFQCLTLLGGGVEVEGAARRPSSRLLAGGVEFRARQAAWWKLAPEQTSLTLQIAYEVQHGQLFQLPVQLPAGWDVDHVETTPTTLRTWSVRQDFPDKGKTTLIVDLQHPLLPDDGKRERPPSAPFRPRGLLLTVRLRPLRPTAIAGRELTFPDAIPWGARTREGSLGIDFDEQLYQPVIKSSLPESEIEEEGPWGKQPLDFYYSYRGQPVTGTLLLRPRAPQVRARCSSEVFLASGRTETRVLLEAESGTVDTIDIAVSVTGHEPWEWRVEQGDNQIRGVQRLTQREARDAAGLVLLQQPLEMAVLAGVWPHREYWRITLARPLRHRVPLLLRADRRLDAAANRWEVPLLVVLNASRMEGEATLHLAGGERVQVEALGLREATASSAPARGRAGPWRTYRYSENLVALTIQGRSRGSEPIAAIIEDARLTTYVAVDGSLQSHFQFQASHWPGGKLPVTLPTGASPLAAQVDGHWLPQLQLGAADSGAVVLELPVPARGGSATQDSTHQFEIVYALAASGSLPWRHAVSPPPELPVPPLQLRQTWRLPPGMVPLEANYRRLPDPGARDESSLWRARLVAKLPDTLGQPWRVQHADAAAQMQALADACQALRKGHAGQTLPLREVLELLQSQGGKEPRGLVLDALALEEAGIGPETPVKLQPLASNQDQTPPWEALGLIAIPTRSAPLLTMRRQWEVWPAGNGLLELPETIETSVAEAVANGHDATGRFSLALEWYGGPVDAEAPATRTVPAQMTLSPGIMNWTEWEALPGTAPAAGITLVRGDSVTAAGLLLAALLCVAFWLNRRRSPRFRLTFLLLWLGTAGIALIWLPPGLRPLAWWPLPLALGLILIWYVIILRRQAPRKALATVIAAAATAAGLLVALWDRPESSQALPPAAPTVYVVPGPADEPENQTVLVPPELLEQMQALTRPTPALSGAVLLSASYDGKIVDGAAVFNAVFQAYCLSKEATTLALPLDGVALLDEVWLDGARAFPKTQAAPQTGYSLNITGAGAHKIELRFSARVVRTDEDRDLQFTVPRLLQSHLRLELPPAAAFVQSLSRYGAETLVSGPERNTLNVELGRLSGPVHLHWFEEVLPPPPVKIQYKEAYSWDLRPDATSLDALLWFDVLQGSTLTLDVQLPPDLEVRGVEPRRPDGGGALRLQNWRVRSGAGGERSLQLRFPSPVSGELLVGLKLVPVGPLSSQTPLPLPTPQGTLVGEGGFLAYQMHSLDVRPNVQRLRPIKTEEFAPFWPLASRPSATSLAHAWAFRRENGTAPVLRVQAYPQATTLQAVQDMRVRVDGRSARMRAIVDLTTAQNDLSFVEWDLVSPQPLTIAGVTGEHVRNWSQSGNRLLVWLEKTSGSAKLEVFGWLPLALPKEGPRLELPCIRVRGAQMQQTTVRVVAGAGLAVAPVRLSNLLPLHGQQPADPDLTYTSKQATYEGTFSVLPATASADVQILTFVEVVERQIRFTTTIDYRIKGGELRTVQIRLRDWEGKDVKLEAAHVLQEHERRRGLDDRTWTLELRPGFHEPFHATWGVGTGLTARTLRYEGVTGSYRVILRGEMPLDEALGGLAAPQVSVVEAASVERWLAVAGPELGVEGVFGLKAVTDYNKALTPWPAERERLHRGNGRVWKFNDAEGTLRLVSQDRSMETAPIRVFLREHSAAVADNQHWLHEAVYWLRHDAHTDLNLTLPAAARVVGLSLDGVELTPLQPEPARMWLPLSGRAGVRCVRLRWVYEPPEPLDHPNLDAPKIEGAEEGPCLWTIHVPPGYEVEGWAYGLKPGLARAAWADLQRADAHLQIVRRLVDQSPGNSALGTQLPAEQRRFTDLCRQVERTLDVCGEAPGETGPGGLSLRDWLRQLRTQFREVTAHTSFEDEPQTTEASREAAGNSRALPSRGVPLYGLTEADVTGPRLQLRAETVRRDRTAWLTSAAWLGGVLFMGGLTYFPSLLLWGRRFAPEQLALAGGGVWLAGWPTAVVLVLLVVAVLARVGRIVVWLGPRLRSQPAPVAIAASKNGSSGPAP